MPLGRRFMWLIGLVTAVLTMMIAIGIYFLNDQIGHLFTNNVEVITMTAPVLKLMAVAYLFDGL